MSHSGCAGCCLAGGAKAAALLVRPRKYRTIARERWFVIALRQRADRRRIANVCGNLFAMAEAFRNGGRGGIRTHGTVSRTAVFKTAALNHSATLPVRFVSPSRAGLSSGEARAVPDVSSCERARARSGAGDVSVAVRRRALPEQRSGPQSVRQGRLSLCAAETGCRAPFGTRPDERAGFSGEKNRKAADPEGRGRDRIGGCAVVRRPARGHAPWVCCSPGPSSGM